MWFHILLYVQLNNHSENGLLSPTELGCVDENRFCMYELLSI